MVNVFSAKTLKTVAAAALISLAPVAASAVTVTDVGLVDASIGVTASTNFDEGAATVSYTWEGASTSGDRVRFFQQFNVSDNPENWNLVLTDFDRQGNSGRSSVRLYQGHAPSGRIGGLTLLAEANVNENNIGVLFGNLSQGDYTLRFNEGANPDSGSAVFAIAAVPLPAGGLLLLTALGGVMVMRRRSSTAA